MGTITLIVLSIPSTSLPKRYHGKVPGLVQMPHSGFQAVSKKAEGRLWTALSIASGLTIVEFVGGIVSQSLALVGDSGHLLADVFALGLSILTIRLGRKPHTSKLTFGYHRAEIFAALVNGATLIIIGLVVIYESYRRFLQPQPVQGTLVLSIALVGLMGNLLMARLLSGHRKSSLNVRGAFLHVLWDILSSIGVLTGGIIIVVTGYRMIDPLIAGLIGILILRNAFGLVFDSSSILMEAAPRHLELAAVARTIQSIRGVRGVHDLHIWTITSGLFALSGHLAVDTNSVEEGSVIVAKVSERLKSLFSIEHVTLQLERETLQGIQEPEKDGR